MDPTYFPLISAAISGVVGIAGLGVAVLVLNLNHRAFRNPLKAELFKKQIEAAGKIGRFARLSHYFVYEWCMKKGWDRKEVAKKALEFSELYHEYEAYLPDVLRCVCVKYWQSLLVVVRAEGADAMIAAVNSESEQSAWLIRYCRRFSGADVLTDKMHPDLNTWDDLTASGLNITFDVVMKWQTPNPEIDRAEMKEIKAIQNGEAVPGGPREGAGMGTAAEPLPSHDGTATPSDSASSLA